jgi:DNA replication protein DnaC
MASLDQIRKLSHELRLHGIHANADLRAQESLANNLHPLDFLQLIMEDERRYRKEVAAKRLVSKAQFRHSVDLEDWDTSYDRGISRQRLKDLGCFSFFNNRENLIIYGKTGEGKTHIAIALGRRLCHEGISTQFCSTNLLFEEIAAQKAAGKYLDFIRKITKTNVLILDDFALRNYTHDEATILLDILEARYRKGIVMITTQVNAQGWTKLFEDAVISEAITDRLTKPAQSLTLKGGSYRDRLNNEKKEKNT